MAEKEAAVLSSEGQRDRDRNEAEGHKIRAITEAEGFMEEQRLRAEGLKQAKILEAEGIAYALERVGKVAETEAGQRALQFMFAKEYVQYMSSLGAQGNSTIFMPTDVGDLTSVLAKGLGLLHSNAFKGTGAASGASGAGPTNSTSADAKEPLDPVGHKIDHTFARYNSQVNKPPTADEPSTGPKWSEEIRELQQELAQYGQVGNRQ